MKSIIQAAVLIAMFGLAGCDNDPPENSPAHFVHGIEGADRLPREALAALAADAGQFWTRCDDALVTLDAGQAGTGPARLVYATPLRLTIEAEGAPPSNPDGVWQGVVRIASATHKTREENEQWSDPISLTAFDMPVWRLTASDAGWIADFRPKADADEQSEYALRYSAPACPQIDFSS